MLESTVSLRERPRVSAYAVKLFAAYTRRYIRKKFHALRLLKRHSPRQDLSRPLIIYLNHASWWDPLVCLDLSRRWFPDRSSFARLDAASLKRYRILRHIGMYPVEQNSLRGTMAFFRTTCAILSVERNIVWLTPQGRFVDVRARPIELRGGIGALATRLPEVEFLPLAIEYAFWTEPRPEILVSFGQATIPREEIPRNAAAWTEWFAEAPRTNWLPIRVSAIHSIGSCSIEGLRGWAPSMTPGACSERA
jgi:1-acyl-sn-glycerol-3-phosphate acyltransferase